ncbi:RNA polymerase subunit sigma [Herbaspirillum sp. BH-1]|uniref:RNA polymerase sigma-70 factor (ECF subfamily) n=1 Tax=Herbaspirillum frisingense TaxID=92645 RepID=A0ABU1PKJ7_9BURK|nr:MULTISPECIES: sigma-70 family RNA polymerase sigma factor [Herbaspirillum]MDR6586007.1 RNA polymerase sigma-70 factor (ECF subfamily) [Herbaspirillum frisingense]PLY61084.1 RNA polymerase subunit sigma [Herbaspirillum sp. BH-1]
MSTLHHSGQPIERLYTEHCAWLQAWLRSRLGNAWDAADLAHDTYLRILRRETEPDAGDARRYLVQIANGLMIDLFRRRSIEAAYLDALGNLPAGQVPCEETRMLAIEALVELDRILHAMAPKARQAFLLCKVDGLSYREVAQVLAVSVSSVEKYIAAALVACYTSLHGSAA